jgi:AdoMet-dependent rRNA methyltransferase SPB1
LNHPLTTNEIKLLAKDTQLMGRIDFRVLLKWRTKMIAFRDDVPDEDQLGDSDSDEAEDSRVRVEEEEDGEEMLQRKQDEHDSNLNEEELESELQELKKKTLKFKKNLERRKKLKEKKAMPTSRDLYEKSSDILDNYSKDDQFFSLSSVKSTKELDNITPSEYDEAYEEEIQETENEFKKMKEFSKTQGDLDLDAQLDDMYEQYLSTKTQRKKSKIPSTNTKKDELYGNQGDEDDEEEEFKFTPSFKNPLLLDNTLKTSGTVKEKQWYSQNVFDILNDVNEDEPTWKKKKVSVESDEDEDEDGDFTEAKSIAKKKKNSGFEEVPKEMHDEQTRATTLALATKLLDKKERRQFIDNAYNRYAFNDDDLPTWFADDEEKHNKPKLPITADEIAKMKARFIEVNERPIKRVLEAQFRNKRRLKFKLEKVKEKASVIAENPDLSNADKAKELQKLYKTTGNKKRKKIFVVGSKQTRTMAPKRKDGAVIKVVDKRMKKDTRAEKVAANRKRKR